MDWIHRNLALIAAIFSHWDEDARQKKLEREMALRRDVYLPAAEAIPRTNSNVLRLLDADQIAIGVQMTADLGIL